MSTLVSSLFSVERPFAVRSGYVVDGQDFRTVETMCCRAAAEAEAASMRSRAMPNVEVLELRPVPAKGAFGGWRVAPEPRKHVCAYLASFAPEYD